MRAPRRCLHQKCSAFVSNSQKLPSEESTAALDLILGACSVAVRLRLPYPWSLQGYGILRGASIVGFRTYGLGSLRPYPDRRHSDALMISCICRCSSGLALRPLLVSLISSLQPSGFGIRVSSFTSFNGRWILAFNWPLQGN